MERRSNIRKSDNIPHCINKLKEIKNIFEEIMAENFSNLKKETDIQVQEAQRAPNKMNPNRPY